VVLALLHMNAAQVLPLVTQAWTIQQAASAAPSGYERLAVEAILQPRRDGPFNLTLLGDYRERPLLPVAPQAISLERVFPLVTCPGRVMLTERALYVQPIPLNNVGGSDSVAVIPLRDIRRVMRRRRLQRETGLEVFLHESAAGAGAGVAPGSVEAAAGLRSCSSSSSSASSSSAGSGGMPGAGASYFFGFQSRGDRDRVYRELLGVLRERRARARRVGALGPASSSGAAGGSGDCDDELGDPSPDSIVQMTRAWQSRRVSNLDYLLFLNTVAGRSASDLTQYPVMPWVLADYSSDALDLTDPATFRDLSKPVGALNATRLARLRERYAEMPRGEGCDPPFLYGTHYSTPGYCLFWLVRAMPEHLLRLQSGRFDAADRLFFDVATAWAGVTSLNSDVKELTPEFYASDGSFLLIPEGLDLGVRQNGRRVGDVTLPPWALDCGEFVRLQREALECAFVSERLHLWIDLIFGHKQRGPAAEAADNVFFWLSYESAVDLDAIGDADRRCALQQQIAEFGQTPRQLFRSPHPNRTGPLLPASLPPAGSAAGTEDGFTAVNLAEGGGAEGASHSASFAAAGPPQPRRSARRSTVRSSAGSGSLAGLGLAAAAAAAAEAAAGSGALLQARGEGEEEAEADALWRSGGGGAASGVADSGAALLPAYACLQDEEWAEVAWSAVHMQGPRGRPAHPDAASAAAAASGVEDGSFSACSFCRLADAVLGALAVLPPAAAAVGLRGEGAAAGVAAPSAFASGLLLLAAARDGSVAMQRLLLSESVAAVEDVLAYDGAAAPLRGEREGEGGSGPSCVAIVPAAQTLLDGSLAGVVELPTLKASPLLLMHRALHGDAAPVPLSCLCPALGGRLLFVGSWDGSVLVIDTAAMAAPLPAASDPAPPGGLALHRLHMSPGAAVSCMRVVAVQTLRFGGAHGLAASRRPTRVSTAPAAGVAAFEGVDEESDSEEGEAAAGGGEPSSAASAAAAPVPVRSVIAVVAAGSWDCTVSLQTVVLTEWRQRGAATLRVTVDADATPDLRVKEHAAPVTALTAWRARGDSGSGRGGRPGVHVVTGDAQGKALWFAAHLGTAASASTSGSGQASPPTGAAAPPALTAAAVSTAVATAQRDSRPLLLRLLRPRTPPRAADLLLDCDIQAACEELVPELARGKGEVTAGGVSGITDMAWAPPLLLPTLAPLAVATATSATAAAQPQPQGRALTYQAHAFCYAATVDGRIAVFKASGRDAATGEAPSLRLHATISTGEVLRCIAVSHDGCCVATGGNAGRVRLWGTAELLERAAEGPATSQDAAPASAQCQAVWGTTASGAPLLVAAAADCAIASMQVGEDEVSYRNSALAALALREGEADGAGELPSAAMGSPRLGGTAEGGRPRASVRFSTAGSMLGDPALLAAAAAAEAAAAAVESMSRAAPAARQRPPVPSVPVPDGNSPPARWVTSLVFCQLHPGAAATAADSDAWGQQYLLAAGSRGGDVCLWTGKRHDFAGSAVSVEEGDREG
jgi:factor associated with neutral sphingomyelinase activation